MTRRNAVRAEAPLDLDGRQRPQGDAAQPAAGAGSVARVETTPIGLIMFTSHWVQALWTLVFVVAMGALAIFGAKESGPMYYVFSLFYGAMLGSLNFVFLPQGDQLRAFGLATGQIRRLAAGVWGITVPLTAGLHLVVIAASSRTGGMMSDEGMLSTCLVGYFALLAYSLYSGLGALVKIDNDAVGVDQVTIRAERELERKNRAGEEAGEGSAEVELNKEERAIFAASTALDAAVTKPLRALGMSLAKWECAAALVVGLGLAFIPWVGDTLGPYLGIALIAALITGRWVLTAYALPKSLLRWLAFSGDRRSWRKVALAETYGATWSVILALILVAYPSLLNSGSTLATKFSPKVILLGAPMMGLILIFQILGTVLLTTLGALRWTKGWALALGAFFVYAMAMVTVFCFQYFFNSDVVHLSGVAIYMAITAVFALIATATFYALIPKQDVRNAGFIQNLG